MQSITNAGYNTGVGMYSLYGVTTGANNVAMGYEALKNNTTANNNTAIGHQSLQDTTTGANNVAMGQAALANNTTGTENTALGYIALAANTTGNYNTAVGQGALDSQTSANHNVAVGWNAGHTITTGSGNVNMGNYAGDAIQSGGSNINIGYDADCAHDSNNAITIGVAITGSDNQFQFGKVSNIVSNTFTSNASWSRSSDVNKKTNIKDDTLGLDFINDLRTVTFNWKPNSEFPKNYDDYSETENHMDTETKLHGMIAQEVKTALDKQGVDTFGGWSEDEDGSQRISQEMFVHPLIKAVQELSTQVDELKQELKTLKGE